MTRTNYVAAVDMISKLKEIAAMDLDAAAATVAAFMLVELDVEAGSVDILDYHAVADYGTVIHPMGLETQIKGGACTGFGMATLEHIVFDPQNGFPVNA